MAFYDDVIALSPTGYWRLNDASGSTVAASVGSNGTYVIEAYGTTEQRTIHYLDGSLLGDSSGDSIRLGGWVSGSSPAPSPMATTCHAVLPMTRINGEDFTVCLIFKHPDVSTETIPGDWVIASLKQTGSSSHTFLLRADTANDVYESYYNEITKDYTSYGVGSNHFAVISYDTAAGAYKFWMDGSYVGSYSASDPYGYNELHIGLGYDYGFATNYQEIVYFRNALLSDTEISDLYLSFLSATAVSNSITLDYYLGAPLVGNSLSVLFNNTGIAPPTGNYEPYVESLNPNHWWRIGDYGLSGEGVYSLPDSGSGGVDAEVAFNNAVQSHNIVVQSDVKKSLKTTSAGYLIANGLFATSTFTISFWMADWPANNNFIMAVNNGSNEGVRLHLDNGGDHIEFYYSFNDDPRLIENGSPSNAVMVTVTNNGGPCELYLDGKPQHVADLTSNKVLQTLVLGADRDGSSLTTGTQFQEVLVWDSVLTDYQISNLYLYATTGEPPVSHYDHLIAWQPVWYYRLGESSGPDAVDEMGGNSLTYNATNAPTYGVASLSARDSDTCVSSTHKIAELNDDIYVATTLYWTLSLIVSPSAQNTYCDIIQIPTSGGGRPFVIYSSTDGGHSTLMFGDGTTWQRRGANPTYTNGQTYHIVVRYDPISATYDVFLNGAQLSLSASGSRTYSAGQTNFMLGDSHKVTPFAGSMDEVAMFDYQLSNDQIYDLWLSMSATLVSNTAQLEFSIFQANYLNRYKCQWDVNESDGDVIVDASGKIATGTE